ncbi:MAG: hypothetical protein EOP06_02345 [Proteobacteria bacterium]|nr:MAG: hypothetical protein EOP06_02345 [Pseudomonadota bacterium]
MVAKKLNAVFKGGCEEDCPPPEAIDCSVEVFRIVRTKPPTVLDFKSFMDSKPNVWSKKPEPLKCRSCGLSVYANSEDAKLARDGSPYLQGRKIASKMLQIMDGKILKTENLNPGGTSHHTWWFKSANPHSGFNVVEEE